ncbi:MAG: hypothetical protein P9X22_02345 [Candidatus Zapsychrus exili]|nr:hypothetical protein [Candidatus Zapsychrus exili]
MNRIFVLLILTSIGSAYGIFYYLNCKRFTDEILSNIKTKTEEKMQRKRMLIARFKNS